MRSQRTAQQREADVSAYLHDLKDRSGGILRHVTARPLRSVAVAADVFRLPRLAATAIPRTVEGIVIDRALAQRHTRRRFFPHTSVLILPRDPDGYLHEPGKQTVRRMVRKADRAGITSRRVVDPDEQLRLIQDADAWERANPNELYRNAFASNEDCLRYRLWLVAYSREGRALAVSVTPMAADWALLRYFRTIGRGTEQTLARYHLMQALTGELVGNGVRYLADETSPVKLSNGLRHYQRVVGFRLVRLKVQKPGACPQASHRCLRAVTSSFRMSNQRASHQIAPVAVNNRPAIDPGDEQSRYEHALLAINAPISCCCVRRRQFN